MNKTLAQLIITLPLLCLPLMASCAPTVLEWSEEVKLHDGKIIVVKRKEELTGTGMPVQKRGFRKYFQFCYAPMNIVWKSKPDYFPETFDIVDGKAYAKVSISTEEQCMLHGYPKTDALYFRWDDGKAWQEIDFQDYPKGLRYNMLSNSSDLTPDRDAHGLVTIAEKVKRDSNIYYFIRKNPAVTGLNDSPSLGGPEGRCEKNKSVKVKTDGTPEVFLPITEKDCN